MGETASGHRDRLDAVEFEPQLPAGGGLPCGVSGVALSDPPWRSFSTEVYIGLAVVYIAFCFAMSKYSRGLERELNRSRGR